MSKQADVGVYMPENLFTYNGKDVTMNVCLSVLAVAREIARRRNISFEDANLLFSKSNTCKLLHEPENALWAESAGYIADKFDEEKSC